MKGDEHSSCAVNANERAREVCVNLFMFGLKQQVFLYFSCNYCLIYCLKKKKANNKGRGHEPVLVSTSTCSLSRHALHSSPHLHRFPRALLSQPCYISLLGLPPNGKQLVWGLPRAHYAQFFNEFPSTSPVQ